MFNGSMGALLGELVAPPHVCPWCGSGEIVLGERLVCVCGRDASQVDVFCALVGCAPVQAEVFLEERKLGYWSAELEPRRKTGRRQPAVRKPPPLLNSFNLFGAQAGGFAAALRVRRTPDARAVYWWLRSRGFTLGDAQRFRWGVYPHKWKIEHAEARKAIGFLKGRLMIPLKDEMDREAGFIGRRVPGLEPRWDNGKYVASRTTQNFSKGRNLYLLAEAREHAEREGWLCLTEGYLDAPALHIAGLENTAAVGTRLITQEQVALVAGLGVPVLVAVDSDSAGESGGDQIEERLREAGVATGRFRWAAKDAAEWLEWWLRSDRSGPAPVREVLEAGRCLL